MFLSEGPISMLIHLSYLEARLYVIFSMRPVERYFHPVVYIPPFMFVLGEGSVKIRGTVHELTQ